MLGGWDSCLAFRDALLPLSTHMRLLNALLRTSIGTQCASMQVVYGWHMPQRHQMHTIISCTLIIPDTVQRWQDQFTLQQCRILRLKTI